MLCRRVLWSIVVLCSFLCVQASAQKDAEKDKGIEDLFYRSWMSGELLKPNPEMSVAFVFIPGFLNEIAFTYFRDFIDVLKQELGVSKSDILILDSSSKNSVESNIENHVSALKSFAKKTQKKMILIGHSKGGAELLHLSLAHPGFFAESVHGAYLIQAAVGGSPVADWMDHAENFPLRREDSLPWWQKIYMKGTRVLLNSLFANYRVGLQSLYQAKDKQSLDRYVTAMTPALRNTVQKKVFYITSTETCDAISKVIQATGCYLLQYGEGDGLVLWKDQFYTGVGQVIMQVQADHADFVLSEPLSKQPRSFRKAFARTLWKHALTLGK
jgi:pimeloyl-ACP methyl ester carboxylesterase